ncbi:MAG: putative lipid II flippase FtsW [Elusimicrobia bacterium CG1_02_37_114]|nr:MAG: putative lipid II flippase FtsW [Elusimicrobia bacterium CG1_02_37_114]PIZ13134.1 MAG: putative lipid II flippase FtsW [Elusimicrobia bacterium CG_4_10_14_0_8_um_filter_37_32]
MTKFYNSNLGLIITSLILLCFGLVMVYSSSAIVTGEKKQDSFFFLKKQVLWAVVSIACFFFFLIYDYKKLQKFSQIGLVVSIILLILVLIIGKPVRDVRRWLTIGPVNFQVSELTKIFIVIFLANYLDRKKSKIKDFFSGLLPALIAVGAVVFLIAIEPDLGIPLVIVIVSAILLFIAGARWIHLFSITAVAAAAGYLAIISKGYRIERFISFLNPWKYSDSSGYQLVQSLISLGSGGFWGRGLGNSQLKKFYLPEMHTDFIFSIVGEELGVIGVLLIVLLFVSLLYNGCKIALEATDLFGTLLAAGVTFTIVIQAFFNIAVCCGCIPTKGISLPFFSYGGSSLITTFIGIGILANISQHKRKDIRIK